MRVCTDCPFFLQRLLALPYGVERTTPEAHTLSIKLPKARRSRVEPRTRKYVSTGIYRCLIPDSIGKFCENFCKSRISVKKRYICLHAHPSPFAGAPETTCSYKFVKNIYECQEKLKFLFESFCLQDKYRINNAFRQIYNLN